MIGKIYLEEGVEMPRKADAGSSGFDVKANITENIILNPMKTALIPTGIYAEIPLGTEIQVRPRSGLAIKHGITVLNSPGTIDSSYRGEIKIILINFSNTSYIIKPKDKIAQLVCAHVESPTFIIAESLEELTESDRGDKGFGSSGK